MPFKACFSWLQCTKPCPGFDVALQPPLLHPSEAPKNVQNSKNFHVENAVESLVAASVGV